MPNTLDATGLTIKTLDEMIGEVQAYLRDNISQQLDVEEESALGQITAAYLAQLREALELFQAGFAAQDPAQGSGFGLSQTASLIGTIRNPATYSVDYLDLGLSAGTYPAGTLIVSVSGQPTVRFQNAATVISPGGTVTGVKMVSQTSGPVRANSGTLTVIAQTVTGFNSVVSDPADASLGALEESDTALRIRRVAEIYRRGSTSTNAIRADVLVVPGVTSVTVTENSSDTTVNGIPPHSFETLVLGGDNQAVAQAIYDSKSAGIQPYGTSVATVVDSSGGAQTVGYTRPTPISFGVTFTGTYLATQYATDADAKAAIAAAIVAKYATTIEGSGVGKDVIWGAYVAAVFACPGVVDGAVQIADFSTTGTTNITIASREYAVLDEGYVAANLFVSSVPGAP